MINLIISSLDPDMKNAPKAPLSIPFDDLKDLLKINQLNLWIWDLKTNNSVDFSSSNPLFSFSDIDSFLTKIHSDDRQKVATQLTTFLAKFADFKMEFRVQVDENSSPEWVLAGGHFVRDEYNNFVKIIGSWRYITEKKKFEELIQLQQSIILQLKQSNKAEENDIDKDKLLTVSEIQALKMIWK